MTDGYVEAWRRPPDWLYLPGQGILGNGFRLDTGDKRGEERMHKTVDGDMEPAAPSLDASGPIRGRGLAPGRDSGGGRGACADAEPVNRHRGGEIRGHASVLGAAARVDDERWAKAQRRLDARNAHIATSLSHHAERVAKRSAAGDRPREDTARQRLEALRRRIADKSKEAASSAGGGVEDRTRDAMMKATVRAGAAAPEAGCGHQESLPVGTIEVRNMHYFQDDGNEFGWTAAGDTSGSTVSGNMGCNAARAAGSDHLAGAPIGQAAGGASGTPPLDNAREAAASRVAWHTAARTMSGER